MQVNKEPYTTGIRHRKPTQTNLKLRSTTKALIYEESYELYRFMILNKQTGTANTRRIVVQYYDPCQSVKYMRRSRTYIYT